jgi:hypothetical protein
MTIEEQVLHRLRDLPPEKKRRVLDFVESLSAGSATGQPLPSLRGLWAGRNPDISEEDIAEARREMWGGFPRDIS